MSSPSLSRATQRELGAGHPPHLAVELDAVPPEVLQRLVRDAIESHLDMDMFAEQRSREHDDRERIAGLRDTALAALDLDGEEP